MPFLAWMIVGASITPNGWVLPPECPSAQRVAERIEAQRLDPMRAPLDVGTLVVVREGEVYVARLRPRASSSDVIELRDRDCKVLIDAVAVKLAFVLDEVRAEPQEAIPSVVPDMPVQPDARTDAERQTLAPEEGPGLPAPWTEPSPPAQPSGGGAEPSNAAPVSSAVRSEPSKTRGLRRPGGAIAVAGGVQSGVVGPVSGGLSGRAALLWRRASLELGATHWFRRQVIGTAAQAILAWGTFGVLRGCARFYPGRLELPVCGGVEVGALTGRGRGFDADYTATLPWVAAIATLRLGWSPHPRFAFGAEVEGLVPVFRYGFSVAGSGLRRDVPPVVVRGGLWVEVRFP